MKETILNIIKDTNITFEQRVLGLARAAENTLDLLEMTDYVKEYREAGIICDLFEGNAPYRPRYILPDYDKFIVEGCEFLNITSPTDIWEATNNLLMFYKHVPSITTMPVYIGNIDYLLEKFVTDENEEECYRAIKLFLKHIDTTITDSFCHANIGPRETKAGLLILKAMRELKLPTPNLTLKYSEETTNRLAIESINTALVTAKPSFAKDSMYREDFGGNEYGIVSCYNGLEVGGGAHTLVRVRLGRLAKKAANKTDFMEKILPELAHEMLGYIDERIRFILEESVFFKVNFLVAEGFIKKEKFTGLFGMVGLAECVNHLMELEGKTGRFGSNDPANELGEDIVKALTKIIKDHRCEYFESEEKKHLLHSQVGIETDAGESPGCRIPIGEEPEMFEHIVQASPFHKYFASGIGDIYSFDETYKKNPQAILDIINGGFNMGLRFFSMYGSDCDVVRVTGYLVKKSEMEKLDCGKVVLRDTTILGKGARDNGRVLTRKLRKI
jgi:YjjI family glycine radical enzyme